MKSQRLTLATGLSAHVLEWDAPGDTTFVLVHGFLDNAYGWFEVAPQLGAHAIATENSPAPRSGAVRDAAV